jgi:L-phenylalanine/L-methionine N-acetyltransferase
MHHRLATPADFDFIYRVYMDEGANKYLTFDPMERGAFIPIYNELLATHTLYVVEEEEQPIATYKLIPKTFRQGHVVYLGSFGINPQLKGKGYGFKVLEEMKELVRNRGYLRLELTVDLHNEAAVHLYKKAGFDIEGTIRKSYRLSTTGEYYDEYLMAVLL